MEGMAACFERLLRQVAQNPGLPASDLELLAEGERREIVEGFNQTREEYRLDLCFHHMFEQQVERTPHLTALVHGEQRLTYAEANARANRLAHYLRTRGVKPGVRVGLFVRRSADMIVSLLGILKAGGAYVPLHPDLPQARLARQIEETGVPILVTELGLLDRLAESGGRIFCLDRDQALLAAQPDTNPESGATPADPIYVIFTSGSTGIPKGVVTRHENVVNYTQSICRQLKQPVPSSAAGLGFANVSTLSEDLGNTPIFAALASGGCLHMIGDEVLMDGQAYGALAEREQIDVLKIAPSHLRALLASGDPAKVLPRKHLIVGGERLRWDVVRQVKEAGRCAIMNHYSPTETTIGCVTCDVDGNMWLESFAAVAPLGRPIGNTVLYVLDRKLRPVPVGVPGELFIGGAGVSNGYLNSPEMTAARFLLDPLNPESGRRFYRSGDRARFLPRGFVEFLGREDDQVKVRGFRVELGEIEAVLSRHPAVKHAVVLLKETPVGDQALTAYLVAPGKPAPGELRGFLGRQVPDYMVPAGFVFLDSFPLNANGKIDRRALAALVHAVTAPEAAPAGSLGPMEEALIGIWREVLGRDDIGVDDNFFELGGHSLLATLVISRVRAAFQVQVPLRSVFEAPTVAGLAEIIAKIQAEAREEEELASLLREVEGLSDEEARKLLDGEA